MLHNNLNIYCFVHVIKVEWKELLREKLACTAIVWVYTVLYWLEKQTETYDNLTILTCYICRLK